MGSPSVHVHGGETLEKKRLASREELQEQVEAMLSDGLARGLPESPPKYKPAKHVDLLENIPLREDGESREAYMARIRKLYAERDGVEA